LSEENISSSAGTKQRNFEPEIELTWEKGGSGLVFYTDENYWKNRESAYTDIFDEESFVQWDFDNSAFYDPHGGDKDAKDFINMQKDRLRREGVPEAKLAENLISSFGGKILKSQGWRVGEKLGENGLTEPVNPEYRHPRNARGLGYHGVKLKDKKIIFPARKRPNPGPVKISTIFDEIEESDEFAEFAHRRAPPTALKRRLVAKSNSVDFPPGANVFHTPRELINQKPFFKISEKTDFVKQPFVFGGIIE